MRGIIGALLRLGRGLSERSVSSARRRFSQAQQRFALVWQRFAGRRLKTRRQRFVAGVMAVVFLIGMVAPIILSQRQAEAWWNGSWTSRRKITFTNAASSENLVNFPVRVSLTSSNIDYAKTQNQGQDIRFVDSDDTTALSYEIEKWDEAGTSEVWVKVPQINAGSNTDFIYMYYENAGASDGQTATSLWGSNYKAVWHHHQDTGNTTLADSTSNSNNGTKLGNLRPNPVAGKIAGAQAYDIGTSDYVDVNNAANDIQTGDLSYSFWFKPTVTFDSSITTDELLISLDDSSVNNWVNAALEESNGTLRFRIGVGGGSETILESTQTSWSSSSWYFITLTQGSASGMRMYINGALNASNPAATSRGTTPYSTVMNLGKALGASNYYNGILDEVRVASVAHSAEWAEADYISQNNAMNSFGSEETGGGGGGGGGGGWYDTCYQYRKKVIFNNSASTENLVNFPARVTLTSGNFDYAKVLSSGNDIRFADSDGTTVLNYEVDTWAYTGTSNLWVNVPQIDANSTVDYIWMYYGCASASSGQNVAGTWNSNFQNVYHMQGTNSSAVLPDSATGNTTENAAKKSGTSAGQPANTAGGMIGAAQDFNRATTDFASVSGLQGSPTNITISGWANLDSGDSFSSDFINIGDRVYLRIDQSGSSTVAGYYDTGGSREFSVPTTFAGTGWHYFSLAVDATGDTQRFMIDGVVVASGTFTAAISYSGGGSDTQFGRHGASFSDPRYWDGKMDEIRISSAARSAEWIEAEYISTSDAMNSFGPEQPFLPDPPVLSLPVDGAPAAPLTPQFNLRASDRRDPSYLRYKIEVCSTSNCSSIVRTIDQTASQTGWSGQDTQSGLAYAASDVVNDSTMAVHTYQAPQLTHTTQYWWRAYSIDPDNSNTWSAASAIFSFTTESPPPPPMLLSPADGATGVNINSPFQLRSTDANSHYLRYKIDICSTSNCSSIVRTIDQTASQTGWITMGAASGTGYAAAPLINDSQVAVHIYQAPLLTASPPTQYWWRGYAIDPGGTNVFSAASSINTFTTAQPSVNIQGGTKIQGGTRIGQ